MTVERDALLLAPLALAAELPWSFIVVRVALLVVPLPLACAAPGLLEGVPVALPLARALTCPFAAVRVALLGPLALARVLTGPLIVAREPRSRGRR